MSDTNTQNTINKIIVPISNPDSAEDLLRLACALVNSEEGRVIGLFILRGDLDDEAETIDQLEPLMEQLLAEGYTVKLQTHKSSSVARGILDAARDEGGDLIILGVQHSSPEQVVLGTIGENVIAAISCPVLIYRPSRTEQKAHRIVVPTDGSLPAKTASRIGIQLAAHYHIETEVVYVQPSYRSRWEGLGHIEQTLEDIPNTEHVKRTLITAQNPAQGLLARLNDDDLLVVGYSGRSDFERWLFGDFSRQMLMRSRCAVVLVSPSVQTNPLFHRARKGFNRFVLRLTPAEQEDIERQAFDMSAANLDYLVLIGIAAMLASLGLLANSVAVIIGAMLVAPFMQPCIAFAVGMATSQMALARRAVMSLLIGIPFAVLIAALTGLLAQGRPFTAEMLARGNPTLLDVMVAFASGVMGAYATARKDIPSALAGVAIAAALMPPLCTFGLGLTAGNLDLGLRAGLLFLTNIVCIAIAAWVVFFLLGLRPVLNKTVERVRYATLVAFALLVLLTMGSLVNLSANTNRSQQVVQWLATAFLPAQIHDVEVQEGIPVKVTVVVRSNTIVNETQVTAIEKMLAEKLSRPVHLEIVFQQTISAP